MIVISVKIDKGVFIPSNIILRPESFYSLEKFPRSSGYDVSVMFAPIFANIMPWAKLFVIFLGEVIYCKYRISLSPHMVTSCSRGIWPSYIVFSSDMYHSGIYNVLVKPIEKYSMWYIWSNETHITHFFISGINVSVDRKSLYRHNQKIIIRQFLFRQIWYNSTYRISKPRSRFSTSKFDAYPFRGNIFTSITSLDRVIVEID